MTPPSFAVSARQASTFSAYRKAVEDVIRAMRANLNATLSLDDMAAIALSSPYHFNRVFRHVTGIPPTQFLYALRLQQAKRLLLTTDLSVTDICFEVGYNSLGSFITRFTDLVGVSPTRLRRLGGDAALLARLEALCRRFPVAPPAAPPRLAGYVVPAAAFAGPIFVGLFSRHIPQGRPLGGTLLTRPGPFQVAQAPPGRYYVLAAGFGWPEQPLGYLLPDEATLQVGTSRGPVLLREGVGPAGAELRLRPVTLLDPPILIALPLLILEALAADAAPSQPVSPPPP